MTDDDLADALDGLFAYDLGFTDSGTHDERLRAEVKAHLGALDEAERRAALGRIGRDRYLSDAALAEGHGLESVVEFAEWLDDRMGIDFR